MEENNRPQRRIKTRPPYDLRRKVLLKNFLREQMSPTHLQTSIQSSMNPEVVQLNDDNSSENEIIDIENVESASDAMTLESSDDAVDQQNSINKSFSEMEIDDNSETEGTTNSPFKNALIFDFTKITELKLSRFNSLKRKTPSLSAEDVKVIANKNSVHLESKDEKNIKIDTTAKESSKDSGGIFKRKYNTYISAWKRKPTIEPGKKRGIMKAKDILHSSKLQFKQQQVDKGNLECKSSKLNRVRKMIAAVHHAIKGESPKFKATSRDCQSNFTRQTALQHNDPGFDFRQSTERFSKYGSFNNGILIDFENEENDEDVPERVRMIKDIKKRQYFRKYKVPYDEPFGSKSVLKDPNNLMSRLLRRKTSVRSVGPDLQEHDRSWSKRSDISWSLNQIRKLEKANKRLREENKLLSESLSSIMADVDVALRAPRRYAYGHCSSSSSGHSNSNQELNHYQDDSFSPRCKVLRTRSVQDRGERRREIKSRLSSRSMCHQPYSRFPPRTLYRAKPCLINPDEVPLLHLELPPVLSASVDRSSNKSISRRSSMPERVTRRPLVNRRSSFTLENKTFSRQSLLSLPTEAFY